MGLIVVAAIIGVVCCVFLPIFYFFKSKPSIAVAWFLAGLVGSCSTSVIGSLDEVREAGAKARENRPERLKEIEKAKQELKQAWEDLKKQ